MRPLDKDAPALSDGLIKVLIDKMQESPPWWLQAFPLHLLILAAKGGHALGPQRHTTNRSISPFLQHKEGCEWRCIFTGSRSRDEPGSRKSRSPGLAGPGAAQGCWLTRYICLGPGRIHTCVSPVLCLHRVSLTFLCSLNLHGWDSVGSLRATGIPIDCRGRRRWE